MWNQPHVLKIVDRQQADGSWKYHGGKVENRSKENYSQLETYRILGQLVEIYGFSKKHSAIRKAAEFLFRFQTVEGDFRGIYGSQYSPNYTAAIMELLIKAGYDNDSRIEKGLQWLRSIRQNDGGWAVPLRTVGVKGYDSLLKAMNRNEPIRPDRSKPFSHWVTGVVLRAFAAHPEHRKSTKMVKGKATRKWALEVKLIEK